jgi:hypothetical protein
MAKLHSASSSVNIVPGVCSRGSRGGGLGEGAAGQQRRGMD